MADEEIILLRPRQPSTEPMGQIVVGPRPPGPIKIEKPSPESEALKLRRQAEAAERKRAEMAAAALRGGNERPSNEAIWEGAKKDKARRESEATRSAPQVVEQQAGPVDPYAAARAGNVQDALAYAQMADQRVAVTRRNPAYGMTQRNIEATGQAQEQVTQGLEAENAVALQGAADIAEFEANEARRMNDAIIDQRAAEFERAEILDEGRQAVEGVHKQLAEATAKFNETTGLDPGRWWASRTAGQKAMAVVGALFRGMAGMDPMQHIKLAIDNDLAAQKASLDLSAQKVDAFSNLQRDATGVYETLRANVADERTADMVFENARLGQVEQQFKALLAQHNVQQMTAEQQRFLGEIAQRRADLTYQIEARTMANPRMITTVRPAAGATTRKVLGTLATEAAKAPTELQKAGLEQHGRERIETIKGQAEVEKERAKSGGVDTKATMAYAKEAAAAEGLIRQVDKILGMEDIPGYGPVGRTTATPFVRHLAGGETLTLEKEVDAVIEQLGRLQSQGVISPTEEERFAEMIRGGTMKGGEDALRRNLSVVRDMAAAKLQSLKKGLAPQDLEYVERGEPGKFKAEPSKDARLPSVVEVDE